MHCLLIESDGFSGTARRIKTYKKWEDCVSEAKLLRSTINSRVFYAYLDDGLFVEYLGESTVRKDKDHSPILPAAPFLMLSGRL